MEISVVIPVFNGISALEGCLGPLMRQWSPAAEVLVVDNGSTDGVAAWIRAVYPAIRVLRNEKNYGASRARNQGIEASSGAWVLTLDCDVVVRDHFMDEMISAIRSAAPKTGMLQARILKKDGAIFSTGITLTFLRRFFDRGLGQKDKGQFDAKPDIFGPCSAAAAYRRSMLDEIKDRFGYFDERFFFLVEDVDLAWRSRLAGWKAVFCPQAVCNHDGNSSKTGRRLRQYYCFRNRRWMLEKNEGFLGRCRNYLLSPFYDVPRWLYLFLTNPYFKDSPRP
jgi:GT2 family glycosyltransferase